MLDTDAAVRTPRAPQSDPDTLAEEHLYLVRHVVNQLAARMPRHADLDDLWAAGAHGLVEAAHRFDPDNGTPFAAYAVQRVRGAVLDATRSIDWASRGVRRTMRAVEQATRDLEQEAQATPDNDAVAARLGVTTEALARHRGAAESASLLHLDQPTRGPDGEREPLSERIEDPDAAAMPDAMLDHQELVGTLRTAVAHLPDTQREVVERHFFGDELFRDIAASMGVTEARVSQLRAEAFNAIRAFLASVGEVVPAVPEQAPGVRRRAAYVAEVAANSTWRSRLEAAHGTYRAHVADAG